MGNARTEGGCLVMWVSRWFNGLHIQASCLHLAHSLTQTGIHETRMCPNAHEQDAHRAQQSHSHVFPCTRTRTTIAGRSVCALCVPVDLATTTIHATTLNVGSTPPLPSPAVIVPSTSPNRRVANTAVACERALVCGQLKLGTSVRPPTDELRAPPLVCCTPKLESLAKHIRICHNVNRGF